MNNSGQVLGKRYLKKILHPQIDCKNIIQCGNNYGGFYVAPKIFDKHQSGKKTIVYSFGIGEDLSFSEYIHEHYDCDIFAFDPTPKAIEFVEKSGIYKSDRFHFFKWGISDKDGISQFHLPKNDDHVSGSVVKHGGVKTESIDVELKTLKTIMRLLGHEEIALLKMDIEGSEFSVIPNILESGMVFHELCVEVHNRFYKDGRRLLKEMLQKLNDKGFYIAYVSSNYQEITFVRV